MAKGSAVSPSAVFNAAKKWLTSGNKTENAILESEDEREKKPIFNPEPLTRQKREWFSMQRARGVSQDSEDPVSLFEHFVVVGLHPSTDISETVNFFKAQKPSERLSFKNEKFTENKYFKGYPMPTYDPKLLFKYPPAKNLPFQDLPSFCFPHGVQAEIVRRTPSMSDFNEIVFGQRHEEFDDHSFIFVLKVANNVTMYGVCLLVDELLQRPPGFLPLFDLMNPKISTPKPPKNLILTKAPRCYCLLTKLPFFDLHFEFLKSLVAQERFDRVKDFSSFSFDVLPTKPKKASIFQKPEREHSERDDSWQQHSLPADLISPDSVQPARVLERQRNTIGSIENIFAELDRSEIQLNFFSTRNQKTGEDSNCHDLRNTSVNEDSEMATFSEDFGHLDARIAKSLEESEEIDSADVEDLNRMANSTLGNEVSEQSHETNQEMDEFWNSASESEGSETSEEEVVAVSNDFGVAATRVWAEANDSSSLRFVLEYHAAKVLPPGTELSFQPMAHLSPIKFFRRALSLQDKRTAHEECYYLAPWTVTTLCRTLSLENILTFFRAAILEKQIVVFSPNPGTLSAIVSSIIALLRPFVWQSVFLPILPTDLIPFLDAPVPFVVGILHKTEEFRQKTANLVRVNAYKNKIRMQGPLPNLPSYFRLYNALLPIHKQLSVMPRRGAGPVYRVTKAEEELSRQFLALIQSYLENLCKTLPLHTITDVQPGMDRVSLVLKESYIESFPVKDRPFMKMLSETQLFAVHSDTVLSTSELNF